MTDSASTTNPAEAPIATELDIVTVRKERPCLACQKPFSSEWSGERICHNCKKGSVWRSGVNWSSSGRQK
jgi:hypothetical protein